MNNVERAKECRYGSGISIPTELTLNHLDYECIHLLSMQYINIILFAGVCVGGYHLPLLFG